MTYQYITPYTYSADLMHIIVLCFGEHGSDPHTLLTGEAPCDTCHAHACLIFAQNGILTDVPMDLLPCTEAKVGTEKMRMVHETDTFLGPLGLVLGCTAKSGNRKVLEGTIRQMQPCQPSDSLLRCLLFNPHIKYIMGSN